MNRFIICLALIFPVLHAQGTDSGKQVKITTVPKRDGKYLWLYGETNTLNYTSIASDVTLTGEVPLEAKQEPNWKYVLENPTLKNFNVRVGVDGLHSNVSGLDGTMHKTLRADQHPDIGFKLSSYKANPRPTPDEYIIDAKGTLTVAGKEKSIDLIINASLNKQTLHIEGSKTLKMSDFGIEPPVTKILFVKLTAKDEVLVSFNMDLQLEAKASP